MTPSSWPVITGSCSLDSRSKVSPRSGSAIRSLIGRLSSISSTTSRRLAASASAKAGSAGSPSFGRVRVSEHDRHSAAAAGRHQPVAAGDVQVRAHLPGRLMDGLPVRSEHDEIPLLEVEPDGAAAVQADRIFEGQLLAAVRTGEVAHGVSSPGFGGQSPGRRKDPSTMKAGLTLLANAQLSARQR